MKNINIMKITYLFLIMILLIPFNIHAESLQNMYDQLASLQNKYESNKNNKNLTESQIKTLNNEIANKSASIEKIRKEIKQAEKEIDESKTKIEDKKIETDGLIQFLQITNGGNIYLEYLFDAENYTDFIYRYEVVKQLTNYNSDLINELETLIKDLQAKEKDLSEKNTKLEKERTELTKKVNTLNFSLSNFKSEGVEIDKDIKDLKTRIKFYEDLGCSRYQDVTTCKSSSAILNAYGWKYPLSKGCVTSEYTGYNIRTDWSGGGGHHAIDLDCVSEGVNVYAAANGNIARIAFYNCGGNSVYINHTVNGKKYTTVYMHLLSVSSDLYIGKAVTDNTIIGKVGGYSTAKQNGGYDICTSGTHLHFGIAEGHHAWDFNSYSINPREIFGFPVLVYNGGGYFYR